jgi:hypothetical protein
MRCSPLQAQQFDSTAIGLPVGRCMNEETLDVAPFPRAGQGWGDVIGAGDRGEYDYADVVADVVGDVDPGHGASATTPSIPGCKYDGFVLAAYLAALERESVRALEEDGGPTAAAAARVGRLLWRYTDELTAMHRYLNSVLATCTAEQQQQQQQRVEATGGFLTISAAAFVAQRFHVLARRAVSMFSLDARLLACHPSAQALSTPTAPNATAGTFEGPAQLDGPSHIDLVPPSVSQRV